MWHRYDRARTIVVLTAAEPWPRMWANRSLAAAEASRAIEEEGRDLRRVLSRPAFEPVEYESVHLREVANRACKAHALAGRGGAGTMQGRHMVHSHLPLGALVPIYC